MPCSNCKRIQLQTGGDFHEHYLKGNIKTCPQPLFCVKQVNNKANPIIRKNPALPFTEKVLCFLNAIDLASSKAVCFEASTAKLTFTKIWCRSLRVGDRLDARDHEGRWYEAEVIAETRANLRIHFMGWGTKFDKEFSRADPDLLPLFSHSSNWRPKLRKGMIIEAKNNDRWYIAQITNIKPSSSSIYTWESLDARACGSVLLSRPSIPPHIIEPASNSISWNITNFQSDMICEFGTHYNNIQIIITSKMLININNNII